MRVHVELMLMQECKEIKWEMNYATVADWMIYVVKNYSFVHHCCSLFQSAMYT